MHVHVHACVSVCVCVCVCVCVVCVWCVCVYICVIILSTLYYLAVIVSGPSHVSAQAINSSTIRVDWEPLISDSPLADITGYVVELRRTSDTIWHHGLMGQPPAIITGLLSDTIYSFRVLPVARNNTSSGILGPFPSSIIATSTLSTVGESILCSRNLSCIKNKCVQTDSSSTLIFLRM